MCYAEGMMITKKRFEPARSLYLRLLDERHQRLSKVEARALLKLRFSAEDIERMQRLTRRAQSGKLTTAERSEAENYDHLSTLLAIMQSLARQTLQKPQHRDPDGNGAR
jgi:hypothetical protein